MSNAPKDSIFEYRYFRLNRRPLSVSKKSYSNMGPIGLHFHNAYELLIIEQGDYKVYCPKLIYEGTGACIVIFRLGTYHGVARQNCDKMPYNFYVANFHQSLVDEMSEHPLIAEGYLDKGSLVIPISDEQLSFFLPLMERLVSLSNSYTHESPMPPLMKGYFMSVLGYIYEFFKEGRGIEFDSGSDDEHYISAVIKDMFEAVERGDGVTSTALANKYHVSLTKLSKDFKKITKMSIKEMIDKLKLERAKNLLKDGFPVRVVAERCGFSSTNYFIQFFKRHMDISPGEYKRVKRSESENK